jgi:hypothetical protein
MLNLISQSMYRLFWGQSWFGGIGKHCVELIMSSNAMDGRSQDLKTMDNLRGTTCPNILAGAYIE